MTEHDKNKEEKCMGCGGCGKKDFDTIQCGHNEGNQDQEGRPVYETSPEDSNQECGGNCQNCGDCGEGCDFSNMDWKLPFFDTETPGFSDIFSEIFPGNTASLYFFKKEPDWDRSPARFPRFGFPEMPSEEEMDLTEAFDHLGPDPDSDFRRIFDCLETPAFLCGPESAADPEGLAALLRILLETELERFGPAGFDPFGSFGKDFNPLGFTSPADCGPGDPTLKFIVPAADNCGAPFMGLSPVNTDDGPCWNWVPKKVTAAIGELTRILQNEKILLLKTGHYVQIDVRTNTVLGLDEDGKNAKLIVQGNIPVITADISPKLAELTTRAIKEPPETQTEAIETMIRLVTALRKEFPFPEHELLGVALDSENGNAPCVLTSAQFQDVATNNIPVELKREIILKHLSGELKLEESLLKALGIWYRIYRIEKVFGDTTNNPQMKRKRELVLKYFNDETKFEDELLEIMKIKEMVSKIRGILEDL